MKTQIPGYIRYRKDYFGEFPPVYEHIPQPSLKERDRRWTEIRNQMALWGLDCLLVWGSDAQFGLCEANFRYVTALPATMGRCLAVFPKKGDPVAFVGTPHDNYEGFCYNWVKDVRTFPTADDVVTLINELGFEKSRIGNVGDLHHFWQWIQQYQIWTDIQKRLPDAKIVDAGPLLWGIEMIKSPEEIELLYEAGRIAELGYKALVDAVKPGVKECEVFAALLGTMIANGAEPNSMVLMDSGNPVFAHPKHPPVTLRKLKQGDIVVAEYHTKYAGYHTHTERAVSIGEPSKESIEIFDVCKKCYENGFKNMKPGVSFRRVIEDLRAPMHAAGMLDVEVGFHSHGSTSAGFPSFIDTDDKLDDIESVILKENMVLTNQIDMFNPKWKHGGGMVLGDSFVITKDGPKVFANIPLKVAVV
jgi:Xaa-Pro aminopeptidase